MIVLPSDFSLNRYGYYVRLVKEEDAAFIIKLRTNPKVRTYLHYTSPDIKAQREWIRNYKKRERKGKDYYFIYYHDGLPCGVNRIYNIQDDGTFTSGSLVFDDGVPSEAVVVATIIMNDIAFEVLGLSFSDCSDGVHIDNKHVIRFNQMFGFVFTGKRETELGIFLTGGMKKDDYLSHSKRIRELYGLSV